MRLMKRDRFSILEGAYARITARFKLSGKRSIDVHVDIVDADYRGEVGNVLINNPNNSF